MITRDRDPSLTDIWHMKDPTAGQWYILETNYDHDKKPLFLDDRRTPANKCMRNMTQQVNLLYAISLGLHLVKI